MPSKFINSLSILLLLLLLCVQSQSRKTLKRNSTLRDSLINLWPLPKEFTHGAQTLTVDPSLTLQTLGAGGNSKIVIEAFERYKGLIFTHRSKDLLKYDVGKLTVVVASDDETLEFGVDEKYNLYIDGGIGRSIISGATIEVFNNFMYLVCSLMPLIVLVIVVDYYSF